MPYSKCSKCKEVKKLEYLNNGLFQHATANFFRDNGINYPYKELVDWTEENDIVDYVSQKNCLKCEMEFYYTDCREFITRTDYDAEVYEMMSSAIYFGFEQKYHNVKKEITKFRRQQSAVEQFFKQVVSKELEKERWNPHRTLGKLQFDMRLRDDGIIYSEDIDEIIDGELILRG